MTQLRLMAFSPSASNASTSDSIRLKRPGNFLLRWSGDMDWAFIVSALLSFMALLLTYDAFSGEREAGTLRLLLSAAIPRDEVLTGKYLGVMLTLGIPFAAGAMVHMLIVRSYGIAAITAGDWLKILVIVLMLLIAGFGAKYQLSGSISDDRGRERPPPRRRGGRGRRR